MIWAMRVPNRIDVHKARMEIKRIRKVTAILLESPTRSAMRPGCVICCSFLAVSLSGWGKSSCSPFDQARVEGEIAESDSLTRRVDGKQTLNRGESAANSSVVFYFSVVKRFNSNSESPGFIGTGRTSLHVYYISINPVLGFFA